jgi:hypothetical protein
MAVRRGASLDEAQRLLRHFGDDELELSRAA